MTMTYQVGEWRAVVAPGRMALLSPELAELATAETWRVMREGGGVADVLQLITGSFGITLASIPDFGVVAIDGGDVNLALRGPLEVRLLSDTGEVVLSGQEVFTWLEHRAEDQVAVSMHSPGARTDPDQGDLLIDAGVVPAAAVWAQIREPAAAPGEPEADTVEPDAVTPDLAAVAAEPAPLVVPPDAAVDGVELASTSAGPGAATDGVEPAPTPPGPDAAADGVEPDSASPVVAPAARLPEAPVPAPAPAPAADAAAAPAPLPEMVPTPVPEEAPPPAPEGAPVLESAPAPGPAAAPAPPSPTLAPIGLQAAPSAPDPASAAGAPASGSLAPPPAPTQADLAAWQAREAGTDGDPTLFGETVPTQLPPEPPADGDYGWDSTVVRSVDTGAMGMGPAHGDAVMPELDETQLAVPAVPSGPPAALSSAWTPPELLMGGDDAFGDHDGRTITAQDLKAMRGGASAGAEGPTEEMPATSGPVVLARICQYGHPNPTRSTECRVCGGPLVGDALQVARPPLGRVTLSTGQDFELVQNLVIGRKPRTPRFGGGDTPRLITVPSPEQDVSRSHVEVRLEGWSVLLTDLDTTNGTTLLRVGQPPRRLQPKEPTLVASGDVFDLGDGVTVTFTDLP